MTFSEAKPGIYTDISFEDYLSCDAVNSSTLKEFRKSPLHFQMARNFKKKPTSSLEFGRIVHTLVLEEKKFWDKYACIVDVNLTTKEGKEIKAKAVERHPGKTIIKESEFKAAESVAINVRKHKKAYDFLLKGQSELSIKWFEDKIPCKGRLDSYFKGASLITDLKTTTNVSTHAFSKTIWQYGYHLQMAWYQRGLRALGLPADKFAFIAIESSFPYGVRVFELNDDVLEDANKKINCWLDMYRICDAENKWDGYSQQIEVIGLPKWANDIEMEA